MKTFVRLPLYAGAVTSGLVVLALGLTTASASSANISHSYRARQAIPAGSLVSLEAAQSNFVELATSTNGSRLIGIAVAKNDSLLAVNESNDTVQVATSGTASALVSNLEGDVHVGDEIAVSPFEGVGAKATIGSHSIGLAQTAFSSHSPGAQARQVTDKQGKTQKIYLGFVRLAVGVGTASSNGGGPELTGLQKLGKSLTGHVISTPRIIVSLIVLAVATVALITLIYSSIYTSIISIGRNPLAKYAVMGSLSKVFGMAIMLALLAGVLIFFLLR